MTTKFKPYQLIGFTMKIILPCILLCNMASYSSEENSHSSARDDEIRIEVNPSIELISLIHYLVADKQYAEGLLPNYLVEIKNYFGHLKEHQAIKFAKLCSTKYQINGDAPMALAVYLDPPPQLEPRIDISNLPADFDPRWNPALIIDYLDQIRSFAVESNFMEFHNSHKSFHQSTICNLEKMIRKEHILKWFSDFFGYYPDNFQMYIGLLNGSCNYGYQLNLPKEQKISVCLLGARWPDKGGVPTYPKEWFLPVIIHEYCHTYVNPLVVRNIEEFRELGEAMLNSSRDQMIQQGYNVWNVILNEYLVRACTIRYWTYAEGNRAIKKMIEKDKECGFSAIEGLVKQLENYENNRIKYENIVSFLPDIIKYFESYLAEL
jgi:hypothetical protein